MQVLDYKEIFDKKLLSFQKNYIIFKLLSSYSINNIHDYFDKNYDELVLKLSNFIPFLNRILEDFYVNNINIYNKDNLEELNLLKKENIRLNLNKTVRVFLSKEKVKKLQTYLIKSSKVNSTFKALSKRYNIFLMKKLSNLSSVSEVDFLSFFSDKRSIDNLFCIYSSHNRRVCLHSYLCYLILNTMLFFHKDKITYDNLYYKVKNRIKFSSIKSLNITFDLYFDISI